MFLWWIIGCVYIIMSRLVKVVTKMVTWCLRMIKVAIFAVWDKKCFSKISKIWDSVVYIFIVLSKPNQLVMSSLVMFFILCFLCFLQGQQCGFLLNIPYLDDFVVGIILLIISLLVLSVCLVLIVKVLSALLKGFQLLILHPNFLLL